MDLSKVTRVTVVSKRGVVFERYDMYDEGAYAVLQDNGRTLKIFPGGYRTSPLRNQEKEET